MTGQKEGFIRGFIRRKFFSEDPGPNAVARKLYEESISLISELNEELETSEKMFSSGLVRRTDLPAHALDPDDFAFSSIEETSHFLARSEAGKLSFLSNPMTNRAVTMTTSAIIQKALMVTSGVDEIAKIIKGITVEPYNCWFIRLKEVVHRFKAEGEGYWMIRFNILTGQTLIFEIPPGDIEEKAFERADFLNKCFPSKYWWRMRSATFTDLGIRVERDQLVSFENFKTDQSGIWVSFINEIRFPSLSHITRGFGMIYTSLYWNKLFLKMVKSIAQRHINLAANLWDVSVDMKNLEDIKALRNRLRTVTGSSIRIHGKGEEWKLLGEKGGQGSGSEKDMRSVRIHATAGFGTSEGIATGDNSNNNLASSRSAQREAKVQIESDQLLLEHFLRGFFSNIIWQAARTGLIPSKVTPKGQDEALTLINPDGSPNWVDIQESYRIKMPEAIEVEPSEQKDKGTILIASGASKESIFQALGLDPEMEKQRLKQEREEEDERREKEGNEVIREEGGESDDDLEDMGDE